MINNTSNKRILGITGGTGAGKSTVSATLATLGCEIISADEVSRSVLQDDCTLLANLCSVFGDEILATDGKLNRAALSKIVFNSPDMLAKLNGIMHPAIVKSMCELAQKSAASTVVFDAPLLVEAGLHVYCDDIWLIVAPKSVRAARIVERDGITVEHATARINSRMDDTELAKYANVIIYNTGTRETLASACAEIFIERFAL